MSPRHLASRLAVACVLLGGGLAFAQPAPAPTGDKVDAKALMQTGVRLLEAKDYLGALAIFKDAYTRFPSAKILINIGTTLKLLGRNAEAANTYQRFLDSPDADAAKKVEVAKVIAELDKTVGQLEIAVTPADAEVQVNNDEWLPAERTMRYRVDQGQFTVNARKAKFNPEAKSAQIVAGEKAAIAITLTAIPEEKPDVIVDPVNSGLQIDDTSHPEDGGGRSKIGAFVLGHFDLDPDHLGGAALIGAIGHVTGALQVRVAAIVGPTFGGFAGASFSFLPGTFRPYVMAGMPIFVSDGARVGFRGAGGLEVQITRNVALIGELGIEYPLSYEPAKDLTLVIPAIGASGRL